MGKDSFVFYLSQFQAIETLTNEQLGRLFRAIFEKQLGNEVVLEKDIEIAFNFINNQMVIDENKYKKKCEINRENGKKGGAPLGNKNAKKQPKQPKQPNGVKNNPNDNDNENDNDYDYENEYDNDLKLYNNFDQNLQCECISKSTKERCSRRSSYSINGKNYCNQHSRKIITEILGDKNDDFSESKIHFADFVTMTNVEYESLVNTYGNDFADQCITVLDNYKGSSGKKYKSDYRAILSWVVDSVKKKNEEKKSFKTKNERSREILEKEREKIKLENEQRGSN